MAWTTDDGWVWVFDLVDHYTCEACVVTGRTSRRSGTDSLPCNRSYDAVIDRHGALAADAARGVEVRHDWGSQGGFNWSSQHLDREVERWAGQRDG